MLKSLHNIDSTTKNVHYAHYDKKKLGSKGDKSKGPNGSSTGSSEQNPNSSSGSGGLLQV